MSGLHIYEGVEAPGLLLPGDVAQLRTHAAEVPRDGFIVEIGSLFGCSAIVMAQVAYHARAILCVDPWVAPIGLDSANVHGDVYAIFRRYVMAYPKIHWWRGLSVEVADAWVLHGEPKIDLLYIDGEHTYDAVLGDLTAWWPHLNKNAKVLGHDAVEGSQVRRAVTDFARERGLSVAYLPNTYGMFMMKVA